MSEKKYVGGQAGRQMDVFILIICIKEIRSKEYHLIWNFKI
jgi:hypothetical protein